MLRAIIFIFLLGLLLGCGQNKPYTEKPVVSPKPVAGNNVIVGAERLDQYLPGLDGQSVAVVANATSMVGDEHLVDVLLANGVNVKKVFAPEHGFRGEADAGETVSDEIDAKTGLPILSLYGDNKKPSADALSGIDSIVFDIQDVGVRFYTYISTLHYIMEAGAEQGIPVIILDRPNPNGFYVDGPVLKPGFESFVGMHPVPLVYGMTIGEYGQMINGEGWLAGGLKADLTIVPLDNYTHNTLYALPVRPSPNLPNMRSIYLYPSLALFEGTIVSIGRGTDFPFQVVGHPDYADGDFEFTPKPNFGAKYPKLEGKLCRGFDFRGEGMPTDTTISLGLLIEFYAHLSKNNTFFLENNFFNRLAGNAVLMQQIKDGVSEDVIRAGWRDDLEAFQQIRAQYLLYP